MGVFGRSVGCVVFAELVFYITFQNGVSKPSPDYEG